MDLPPNPPEPPAPILLPPHCSIDAAASLRDALLAIEAPAGVAIDAGAVETIGQAVLQLLLAARNDAVADGRAFALIGTSPAFAARIEALGLGDRLGLTALQGS